MTQDPKILQYLTSIESCKEPYSWIEINSILSSEDAWNKCENSEWLIFLLQRSDYNVLLLEKIISNVMFECMSILKIDEIVQSQIKDVIELHKHNTDYSFLKSKIRELYLIQTIPRQILNSISFFCRIVLKNNTNAEVIFQFDDIRDIYFVPFMYLEKHGFTKPDLSNMIRTQISWDEVKIHLDDFKASKGL